MPDSVRHYLGSALLGMLSVLVVLAICEVFMLTIVDYPRSFPPVGLFEPDAERTFRLSPNYSGTYLKGGKRFHVRTNAAGFRDPREFSALDAKRPRILAIGDSFVFGMPVSRDEAFVGVIESTLAEEPGNKGWQVLNLGVPSYGTFQEAIVLETFAPQLRPRAVLVGFYVGNDFEDNTFPADASRYRVHGGIQVTQQAASAAAERFGEIGFQFNMLLVRSATYHFIRHRLASVKTKPPKVRSAVSVERTATALARIQQYCAAQNIGLLVLIVPEKRDVVEAEDAIARLDLISLLETRGVQHYDATADLRAAPDPAALFEARGSHFTVRGNALVGRRLAEQFLTLGLL